MNKILADKIGVVISKDAYGKYQTEFVFVKNAEAAISNNHIELLEITSDRPLPVALREARTALDKLSVALNRGEYVLTTPQAPKVKSE